MNAILIDRIKQYAKQHADAAIIHRRHLHRNPELSFNEFNTSLYVQQELTRLGIGTQKIAGTGILATIQGGIGGGAVIALRSDMDALPIIEETELEYRSQTEGVMHACGHDAHMSILLGVASVLQSMRAEFSGTVKLIFQPAEEKLPGGAKKVIEEGALKSPDVELVLGQHVRPDLPVGKVAICKGFAMASMDEIFVRIIGKGGHAAQPHTVIDPVAIAAQLIVSLQQVVSRFANPQTATVLSFGKVIANGAINIIPDEVMLLGTFRTFDEKWRNEAYECMKYLAKNIVEGLGGKCEFDIIRGYPALYNDELLSTAWTQQAVDYLGKENVIEIEKWMAAEDFAYYSRHKPSVFYYLGVGNAEKSITAPLHSAKFNIDEAALEIGIGIMAFAALEQLRNPIKETGNKYLVTGA